MRSAGLLLLLAAAAFPQAAPRPPPDRKPETIDYGKPDQYSRIPERDGDAALIKKLAAPLEDEDPEQTFRNIHAFIARVPHVPEGWEPDYRDFGRLMEGFDHAGCASHALLFASLARACGIPAVYVKSSAHEWIRGYVAKGETGSFSGHVFLEVFVGGKWKLLDAQGMRIWDAHDTGDPEFPGGLLAYEKGWDHFAMVHSTRRDDYIREALHRWKGFDVTKLRKNENEGRALLPEVFAITLSGEWEVLAERTRVTMSFDHGYWEEWKPKVRGKILLVTSIGGRTDIPEAEADAWLPLPLGKLRDAARAGKSGVLKRRLDDGTLVVLLYAAGRNELMALLWLTDFEQIRCDFAKR
jgi:Transglutaminase-like superfamily